MTGWLETVHKLQLHNSTKDQKINATHLLGVC